MSPEQWGDVGRWGSGWQRRAWESAAWSRAWQQGATSGGASGSWQPASWQTPAAERSSVAASATSQALTEAALNEDQERRAAGLCGPWAAWDARVFQRINVEEAQRVETTARPSKRHTNLAKSFQNFRRQTMHRLLKTQVLARYFKVWRFKSGAAPPSPDHFLWSDDNMLAFLNMHITYQAQMLWRQAQTTPVKACVIPPSLIDLWRSALVAKHTAWVEKNAADLDPNRFVRRPLPWWIEEAGETYQPTPLELQSAASAGIGSGGSPYALAEKLEMHLQEAFKQADLGAAQGDQPLAERLASMVATGEVWTFVHEVASQHNRGVFASAAMDQVHRRHFQEALAARKQDRRAECNTNQYQHSKGSTNRRGRAGDRGECPRTTTPWLLQLRCRFQPTLLQQLRAS